MTNASGCVVKEWSVGDLMLINGHMDYSFIKSNNNPSVIADKRYDNNLLEKVSAIADTENIKLRKNNKSLPKSIHLNLIDNPDIAQTILITCLGLRIDCTLIGLHTLKIKETDRLVALKNEIEKFEVDKIEITEDSITLKNNSDLKHDVTIETYNDHRMAMSFAPLSLLVPINIKNPEVVTKSYFNFWNDLESLGFNILKK